VAETSSSQGGMTENMKLLDQETYNNVLVGNVLLPAGFEEEDLSNSDSESLESDEMSDSEYDSIYKRRMTDKTRNNTQ
jgi:hypothetical protein